MGAFVPHPLAVKICLEVFLVASAEFGGQMRGKKILVVDDEPEIRQMLDEFLKEKGYQPLLANSGAEALSMYKREQPDLVLLDYRIAGECGLNMLRELKNLAPAACVIMLASVLDEGLHRTLMSEGASDYITKPIDLQRLDLALRTRITLLGISR